MTGKFGVGTAVLPFGALGMVTEKSTPANAELVAGWVCFELAVTSVRSPMTAEGLTTNTFPVPLEVFIVTLVLPMQVLVVVPEQKPEFSQTPSIVSQVPPVPHSAFVVQAVCPEQVAGLVQLAVVVQAVEAAHCTPPLIEPLLPLSTHAVGPVE